ncbi:MAG: hypothetical protein Q8N89_15395 [Azonexus sp.]|nr:hypothetical protein [Azonexus sp.]
MNRLEGAKACIQAAGQGWTSGQLRFQGSYILPPEQRAHGCVWHYVLLGERIVDEWRSKGARLPELLAFARLRPLAATLAQGKLAF